MPNCEKCGTSRQDMSRCSSCKFVFYCNTECQHDDWSHHQNICGNGNKLFELKDADDLFAIFLNMVATTDLTELIETMERETLSTAAHKLVNAFPNVLGKWLLPLQRHFENAFEDEDESTLVELFMQKKEIDLNFGPTSMLLIQPKGGWKDLTLDIDEWLYEERSKLSILQRKHAPTADVFGRVEDVLQAAKQRRQMALNLVVTKNRKRHQIVETALARKGIAETLRNLQDFLLSDERKELRKVIRIAGLIPLLLAFCVIAVVALSTARGLNTATSIPLTYGPDVQIIPLHWTTEIDLLLTLKRAPLKWMKLRQDSVAIEDVYKNWTNTMLRVKLETVTLKTKINALQQDIETMQPTTPLEDFKIGDAKEIAEVEQKINVLVKKNNPRFTQKLLKLSEYLRQLKGESKFDHTVLKQLLQSLAELRELLDKKTTEEMDLKNGRENMVRVVAKWHSVGVGQIGKEDELLGLFDALHAHQSSIAIVSLCGIMASGLSRLYVSQLKRD